MIIIPEIETVVILNPRTSTGSTYREALEKYPRAMMIYRHMEADGIPMGYDRWPKVGVVRQPVSRLHSLWSFLRNTEARTFRDDDASYKKRQSKAASLPFEEWLLTNREPFSTPDTSYGVSKFWAQYTQRWQVPPNFKSQFIWLRPDLGTEIYQFDKLDSFRNRLDLKLDKVVNETDSNSQCPNFHDLSPQSISHMHKYFQWDLDVTYV